MKKVDANEEGIDKLTGVIETAMGKLKKVRKHTDRLDKQLAVSDCLRGGGAAAGGETAGKVDRWEEREVGRLLEEGVKESQIQNEECYFSFVCFFVEKASSFENGNSILGGDVSFFCLYSHEKEKGYN